MRFADIYEKELDFVAIRTVQLLERRSVLAERRSGIAGEEQNNRALPLEARQADGILLRELCRLAVAGLFVN